jgi:hypothetical protein
VLALLAISDTTTAPAARSKYTGSTAVIQGWPLVDQGLQVSGLLVADRFQVKVIGQGSGLDKERRHELLGAFDLKGLAALKPALKAKEERTVRALPPGRQAPVTVPLPKTAVLEPAA